MDVYIYTHIYISDDTDPCKLGGIEGYTTHDNHKGKTSTKLTSFFQYFEGTLIFYYLDTSTQTWVHKDEDLLLGARLKKLYIGDY